MPVDIKPLGRRITHMNVQRLNIILEALKYGSMTKAAEKDGKVGFYIPSTFLSSKQLSGQ